MLLHSLIALASLQQVSIAPPSQGPIDPQPKQPNIVIVIADDFGVDQVAAYGEGVTACTPNIDRLASEGMLFRNAWTNPVCTPSRASIWTGKHAFRVGVGSPGRGAVLDLAETTMADILSTYRTAYAGKWHLGGNDADHPNLAGFDDFAGGLGGGVGDYYSWSKTTNGSTVTSTNYATTETANDAIAAIQLLPEPWLVVVSFNAPHAPYQEPPASLCATVDCTLPICSTLPPNPSNGEIGHAMIEAMDAEFGRVLQTLDAVAPSAYVIFIGDNGTARQVVQAPFDPQRAKGSAYEGGLNVPLIIRGPGVAQAESAGLVSSVDLFATVSELAGTPFGALDSISMVPYFSNPTAQLREFVFAEVFEPNGFGPYSRHDRGVRDARYKLVRKLNEADELYDLLLDPFENSNLLPNLSSAEQLAYDGLVAELVRLGVD